MTTARAATPAPQAVTAGRAAPTSHVPPGPVAGGASPGRFRAVVLWIDGAWRPVRVSRDGWVTVEEAARILGVRTQVVRERSRAPGLVSVGVGRPGSPRMWRLTDLCPEVAVSARPRPSPAVAGPG